MVCNTQTNPNYGFYTTPFERMNAILDQGITVFYALQVGLDAWPHDTCKSASADRVHASS